MDWLTDQGRVVLEARCLPGETIPNMFRRCANRAAELQGDDAFAERMLSYMEKGWFGLATPVASNFGTDRGLPISCYGVDVPDTMEGIGQSNVELMVLTKSGGGVGVNYTPVRPRNSTIGKNGVSEGTIPFMKITDSTILASNQGSVRRGATSINLAFSHGDFKEFIDIRRPHGDINRQCPNVHQCAIITDDDMNAVIDGDSKARLKMFRLLKARKETGEPHIMFVDNVNRQNPAIYKKEGLKVSMTNICTEILLYTDDEIGFCCCVSSVNLAKWDEWGEDPQFIRDCIRFLDAVLEEFIQKTKYNPHFARVRAGAVDGRPLGLGVMGWHTLLQQRGIPFESFQAMQLSAQIFSKMRTKAELETRQLAKEFGALWWGDTNIRNSHLMALAPTHSNSRALGVSPSCEPLHSNVFEDKTAVGTFIRKNSNLEALLDSKGENTSTTWATILEDNGSVQNLSCLTDREKEVYLTAQEIGPMALIQGAAQRNKWVDQGQSLNLFVPEDISGVDMWNLHREAWELGIKTLYYLFSSSSLRGDDVFGGSCKSCEG